VLIHGKHCIVSVTGFVSSGVEINCARGPRSSGFPMSYCHLMKEVEPFFTVLEVS
jgi:hypothetical protein